MKARITAGLTALAMLGSAMPMAAFPVMTSITAHAEEYTEETYGDLKIHKYTTYVEIAGCNDSATSLTIPATIDGLPVISIGGGAFYNDGKNLTSITLPESIINIGSYAFYYCENLEKIVLPDSVQELGESAFKYCSALKSVKLPKYLKMIESSMFEGCISLISIEIPATVTEIKSHAFGNSGLTSVTVSENVKIDSCAFVDCKQLKTVKLSKGVTLDNSCFSKCSVLTSVTLPEDLKTIPEHCFNSCESLTSITIPDTVTKIGVYAFANCTALTEAKMPSKLEAIEIHAFENCKALRSINIPGTVEAISWYAFSGCTALNSVKIGDGVSKLESWCFKDCTSLTSVTLPFSVYEISGGTFENNAKLQSITFLNPNCSIYKNSSNAICNYTLNNKNYFTGVIYGYPGSTAQTYAEKNGYHFESLGSAPQSAGLGDINEDNTVNASDAAQILIAAAAEGAGGGYGLTDAQMQAADLNADGTVNASDAALVLIYAAYVGAEENPVSLEEFLKNR